MIKPWKKISSKSLIKNPWIEITEDSYLANNQECNWYLMHDPDNVIMIAKTDTDQIVLIRLYRPGTNAIHWEFPAGGIDTNKGESEPLISAERELLEETGFAGIEPQVFAKLSVNSSRTTSYCYGVFINNAKLIAEKQLDHLEDIEVGLFSVEQVKEKIKNQEIVVGTQIAFFYLAKELGLI